MLSLCQGRTSHLYIYKLPKECMRMEALSKKVLVLGIDGMDPLQTRKYLDMGLMPNKQRRGKTRFTHDWRAPYRYPTYVDNLRDWRIPNSTWDN